MKEKYTNDPAIIEKDICLFCGTELDWQNEGILDDFIEDTFHLTTWIHNVPCPQCGATHTATFVVDKEDYVASNTDDWQVRVGSGFMNIYGTREEYNDTDDTDTIEFDYYMDCVSIYAVLDEEGIK